MKSDVDVKMISADAPVIFAKACELFILELSLRSWLYAENGNRQMLQKSDVAKAISSSEAFDFLIDIVPKLDEEDEVTGGRNEEEVVPSQGPDVVPFPVINPNQVQQNCAEHEITGQWRGGRHSDGTQLMDFNFLDLLAGENMTQGSGVAGQVQQSNDSQFPVMGGNLLDQNYYYAREYHGESRQGALPRSTNAVLISLTGGNHLRLNSYIAGKYRRESRRGRPPRPSDAVQIPLTGARQLQLNSFDATPENQELTVYGGNKIRPQPPLYEVPENDELTVYGGNRFGPQSPFYKVPQSEELNGDLAVYGGNKLGHQSPLYKAPQGQELNDELTVFGGNRLGTQSPSSSQLFFPTLGDNRVNNDYI
ncbi:Nuclear transcription factor y subunit c [Thalictrum thalictroides]|uniref:Nuclear transcription factor y subunit c n=1 Tax=Thalictrum thalictroides TaxID=46969 RepID=A0A7J6X2I2_THATH|nr:Nuclear transcription factor y subunit c [Thalictrum thalictroides]